MKRGLLLTWGLVTAFLVSFAASAYFMMNAKNLIFAEDKQEISVLLEQIESKDMEIADLKEQVERYQTLYEAAAAAKPEIIEVTVKPTPTATSTATVKPSGTQSADKTTTPTKTSKPTATQKPTTTQKPATTKTAKPTSSADE